jgi:hypothetical protein
MSAPVCQVHMPSLQPSILLVSMLPFGGKSKFTEICCATDSNILKSHSGCTETFYKTALAEQIQAEPARTSEEKQQMLELLQRFEEEAVEGSDEDEDADGIVSRLQGIDLGMLYFISMSSSLKSPRPDGMDHDVLWGLLSEDEQQKFLKIVTDPASEDSKRLLDAQELADSRQEPWWISNEAVSEGEAPSIKPMSQSMLAPTPFNPMLLFNVFHIRWVKLKFGIPHFD